MNTRTKCVMKRWRQSTWESRRGSNWTRRGRGDNCITSLGVQIVIVGGAHCDCGRLHHVTVSFSTDGLIFIARLTCSLTSCSTSYATSTAFHRSAATSFFFFFFFDVIIISSIITLAVMSSLICTFLFDFLVWPNIEQFRLDGLIFHISWRFNSTFVLLITFLSL